MMLGAGAVLEASRYSIGTLKHLGPGFYPALLGTALAVVGAIIAGAALAKPTVEEEADPLLEGSTDQRGPDWRGWGCIIGGVVLFILLAWATGLASAIFACVFVSARGDRSATLKGSFILALVMTVLRHLRVRLPAGHQHAALAVAVRIMSSSLSGLWHGFEVALLPANHDVVLRRRAGRQHRRRAAGTWRAGHGVDPAAADLRHEAGGGHPDARGHLLRGAVRRRDLLDPAQPALPPAACRHLPGWLPADQARQGRHGARG